MRNYERPILEGLHVLFVDESPDERELFDLRVRAYDLAVRTASTVEEALAVIERGDTELVIAEVSFPERDGFELAQALTRRAQEPGELIPILAASGVVSPQTDAAIVASGFSGHLVKPYSAEALIGAIEREIPAIEVLRAWRQRYRGQRVKLGQLRARLARQRATLQLQRARLAVEFGPAEQREAATRLLVAATACDFVESETGRPAEGCDVRTMQQLDDGRQSWIVITVSADEVIPVEVLVGPRSRTVALKLLPYGIDR